MPITINTAQKKQSRDNNASSGGSSGGSSERPQWVTWLIEAGIITIVVIIAILVRLSIYDIAIVTSSSMQPTLQVGDRIVFDHRRSSQGQWQRGDIIFFYPPQSWGESDGSLLVKRLIGLPGEKVEVRTGHVFINDKEIPKHTVEDIEDNVPPLQLANDQYFVLGDNRDNSDDSRRHGPINKSDVSGRATLRLWPAPGRLPS